jgi:ribosome-binding factor A
VSSDLSLARVFFRTLSDCEDGQRSLERAKPFIRRCLGEETRLRRVPELDFRLDESLDNAQRIEQILREIKEESG